MTIDINELRKDKRPQSSTIVHALLDRLKAAEEDAAHQKALADSALRVAEGWEEKCNALRAKIEAMERQEPIGEIVAFGEFLHEPSWKRGKLPHLGTKLYDLPGAQPAPSVPTGWKLVPIDPTRNMLDIMDLGSNMLYRYRALLAAAPEAKP